MKNSRLPSPPRIDQGMRPPDPTEPGKESSDLIADRGLNGGVAHDSFLYVAAIGFELSRRFIPPSCGAQQ
jgi:hypothetical protein